jgi:deoxyribose-phosphate aldolase
MDIKEILKKVDHTNLSLTAAFDDIKESCNEGIFYECASVCIPPCFVKAASDYVQGAIKICTVTGFPNGYSSTEVKCCEAEQAVRSGADEIDMVINIGMLKAKKYKELLDEIKAIKCTVGNRILKVIIETCLLTKEEKIKMCEIVSDSGADFIKTSTGFSTGGATREDIILFKNYVAPHVRIKAAGGISTLADAEDFLNLGADRLGSSRIVRIIKAMDVKGSGY